MATGIPLRWIGPEVVLTGKHSHASDVYSFGVLMAEIFTRGRLPFGDLDDATLVGRLGAGDWEPADHTGVPGTVDASFLAVHRACLCRDPGGRPGFGEIGDRFAAYGGTAV